MSLRVAYCCTLHNEEDVIYWQLLYYYKVGVRDFFVQYNTADDLTRLLVRTFAIRHSNVTLHEFDNPDRDYEGFPARKMWLHQQAGDAGFDWIIPVDADELITTQDKGSRPGFSIVDWLENILPDAQPDDCTKFPAYNYTPVQEDDWLEVNPFKRIRHRIDKLRLDRKSVV